MKTSSCEGLLRRLSVFIQPGEEKTCACVCVSVCVCVCVCMCVCVVGREEMDGLVEKSLMKTSRRDLKD